MNCVVMLPGTDDKPKGGLSRHVYEISKRLAKRNFEVLNVKPSVDGCFHVSKIENTYTLLQIPVSFETVYRRLDRMGELIKYASNYLRYNETVKEFSRTYDGTMLMHNHGYYGLPPPFSRNRFKRLSTFHGSAPLDMIQKGQSKIKSKLLNGLLKEFYIRADGWTAISQRVRASASYLYGIDINEIEVVRHGVDVAFFSKKVSNYEIENLETKFQLKKLHKILFLGTLDKGKRIDILLQAVKILNDERHDIMLIIRSGWGDFYNETLKLIKFFHLEDVVTVIPQLIYGAELRALYQIADVFISTHEFTGPATALLEAMASSTPVIVSHGGNNEIVDNSNGIMLEELSPISLANAIRALLEDPAFARKLGENAMCKMREGYDWDNVVVPKYIEAYNRINQER